MIPHYNVKTAACGGLRNWEGVTTTTKFPIEEGVTVTLTCKDGLSHVGDSVVTCNLLYYEGYKYTFRPKCEVGDSGSDVVTGNLARIMQFSHVLVKIRHFQYVNSAQSSHSSHFTLRSFFTWPSYPLF